MNKKSEKFAIAWVPRITALCIAFLTEVVAAQITDNLFAVIVAGCLGFLVSLIIMRRNQA